MDVMEGRKQVQESLANLRDLLFSKKLILFLGEEISALDGKFNDWWQLIEYDVKNGCQRLEMQEKSFMESLQPPGQSQIHNTLRSVGEFSIIFTTNMDRLIEKLIWRGEVIEKLRLDQMVNFDPIQWSTYNSSNKLLIKMFGDNGIVTGFNMLHKNILHDLPHCIQEQLQNIFDQNSVLFIGLDRQKYSSFFDKIVYKSKTDHYMLCKKEETRVISEGSLNILTADLELWEFAKYLTSARIDEEIIPNQVYERSYLASQREEYLMQQLRLEIMATEIAFHTLQITNALATDEVLLKQSRPKLVDIYRKDPLGIYSDENVERAYQAMLLRRNNLLKLIESGKVPVTCVFFYEEFLKEVEKSLNENADKREQRRLAVIKYAESILLAQSVLRPNSTLELLVVDGLTKEEMMTMQKETFALVRLKERTDEAVCYAETAIPGRKLLQTHYVNVNGQEVHLKRRVYEGSVAKAWSNKDSILKLTAKLMEVNKELNALAPDIREKLESLNRVVGMLDKSIDSASLVHLGGGSFGDVYKALWNNMTVALKFQKEAAHPDDLYKFQQEYSSLLQCQHDNIVRVYKMTVENNRLGLIMEFIDGVDLRKLLTDKGPQPTEIVYRCATQMSDAIAYLHSLKVVHRDVKTDNILVAQDLQKFKLADFGLARVVEKTEQYKTVKGTYRYMAPEILKSSKIGGAKYSLTVDVYSYGLVILEVITGRPVFHNLTRDEMESGKRDGTLKPTIPDWCSDKHGEVITEVVKRSISEVERRPQMEKIHQLLISNSLEKSAMNEIEDENEESTLEVVCLGTGKGATTLLTGEPSSSFVIMHRKKPLLIVDLGFGVVHSFKKHIGYAACFENVYITHNHGDHAAELPVILCIVCGKQRIPTIFAAPEVMYRLKTQRLAEIKSAAELESLAELKTCEPGGRRTPIGTSGEFSIAVLPSQHSETCYGFILYEHDKPVLGYTGDSGYNKSLYDQLFVAPNVILDARMHSTYEHAGFEDVIDYLESKKSGQKQQIFVTGYGTLAEYPVDGIEGVAQMRTGDKYSLVSSNDILSKETRHSSRTNITVDYIVPASVAL
ncbi:hypothetical protein CHUAL_005037 [Chamberlinius hualienensis]